MVWVTEKQCISLLKFLELTPQLNSHSNLKTEIFCFYSSELKNLKQTFNLLIEAKANGWDKYTTPDPKTKIRYANSLQNMGLLKENSGSLCLTKTALALIDYTDINNINSDDLVKPENIKHSIAFEKIILENLFRIISDKSQETSKAYTYASELFFRLQEFFVACDHLEVNKIINDLDLLYFCQIINSSGFELKRFFKLNEVERLELSKLWRALADSANFPNAQPQSSLEKAIFTYTRPRAKKSIQLDIRIRCCNLLNAYDELRKNNSIPLITDDYSIIRNIDRINNEQELATKSNKVTLPIEHQLIITGCPGSGKSSYLDKTLKTADPDIQIMRVTAYPEYSYSDLIGCYKPIPVYQKSDDIISSNGEAFDKGVPKINYQFVKGPLIEQYILAIKNPNYNFALIIEEINRTNCNILFGDVFQLLDRINGISEYTVDALPDLASLLSENGISTKIALPSNLYICGTMNSADKGVFALDSAFRRRWDFIYKGYSDRCNYPEESRKILYGNIEYDWDLFRDRINTVLEQLSIHEDKMIGPYFLRINELQDPVRVCNKLFLYLWDDVLRFQRNELMEFTSFSLLSKAWKNGKGTPLKIELNN